MPVRATVHARQNVTASIRRRNERRLGQRRNDTQAPAGAELVRARPGPTAEPPVVTRRNRLGESIAETPEPGRHLDLDLDAPHGRHELVKLLLDEPGADVQHTRVGKGAGLGLLQVDTAVAASAESCAQDLGVDPAAGMGRQGKQASAACRPPPRARPIRRGRRRSPRHRIASAGSPPLSPGRTAASPCSARRCRGTGRAAGAAAAP